MFSLFGFIGPIFSVYTAVVFKAVFNGNQPFAGETLRQPVVVLTTATVVMFGLMIIGSIIWKSFGDLTFKSLTKVIGISETCFGVYLGIMMDKIFPTKPTSVD